MGSELSYFNASRVKSSLLKDFLCSLSLLFVSERGFDNITDFLALNVLGAGFSRHADLGLICLKFPSNTLTKNSKLNTSLLPYLRGPSYG